MNDIQSMLATLGKNKTEELLIFIKPHLTERSHKLLNNLAAQDWSQAAHEAHRILASAGLFTSEALIDSLKQVEQQNETHLKQDAFQQQLRRQLQENCQQLDNLLAQLKEL